ncbi:hypothetical protein EMPS_01361 [Entomortierella parvispora]|uniref:Cell cycle control protein n=1 Tax=Entomortierella parvispora TaxID=205924 RepID=A0A9P3H2R2_9FUNG|nr:hypothetical protein EMPS_01361 [Entomortierella parvispora]
MMDEPPKHRPPNTSFKQQRLKAWQPILTAKSVLPTFFIIGILFAPLGGLLVWKDGMVTELSFDYTACSSVTTPTVIPGVSWAHPSSVGDFDPPTYVNATGPVTITVQGQVNPANIHTYQVGRCNIQLTFPVDLQPPVMMYYKLTNFYQNHRKYTKSLDYKQLGGEASSKESIISRKGCTINPADPLVYPCGLIANSMFNDTISGLTAVPTPGTEAPATGENYTFADTGIAWSTDRTKYGNYGYTNLSAIVPPPNWSIRYPSDTYSADFPPPKITEDEHFQVWMRTAGWPTFLKAYGRNDNTVLKKGTYQMTIDMNFPIDTYGGKKYIVFSTLGATGGRNNVLGIGYIIAAVLSAALGIIFTAFHIVRPRVIGDHSKISFGGEATVHTRSANRADDVGGNRIRSRYEDD